MSQSHARPKGRNVDMKRNSVPTNTKDGVTVPKKTTEDKLETSALKWLRSTSKTTDITVTVPSATFGSCDHCRRYQGFYAGSDPMDLKRV
jgi:hypothetical protein